MKVLMATDHYYPYPGGITEHTYHLSRELKNLGVDVEILTSNFPERYIEEPPDAEEIKIYRVGKSYFFRANKSQTCISLSSKIASEIRSIVEQGNYDIVHSQNSVLPTIPYLSLLFAKKYRFATFHSYHGFSLGYEVFKPIFLPVFEKLNGKIFVSRPALITIERHFNVEDYRVIPNGVDTNKFTPHGPIFDLPFEKRPGEVLILFVGRLEVRKGTKYLIEAFNYLGKIHDNLKLVIAGDGPLRKKLENMIDPTVKNRVYFLGFVSSYKLPLLYRACDIFVSPAITGESFGIVLLEAMASGKPVVAFDNEGYREVLDDGIQGFLTPSKNVPKLIEKIEELVSNPDLRAQMGQAGRKKALEYSWPVIAKRVLEYYEDVIKSGKK
ncbi:MAG: glycosyltransferase family 4 protein [candidate division WOR-3 bacterium]